MSMYLKLGTFDLAGKVYDNIKPSGGYFDIKQDGATSLRTGARKGDPKGMSVSFFVCFVTEAEASAFLAYVAPYSPEDPDFDEAEGADIDLFLRTSDWKYKVWGVVTKPATLNKVSTDYLQYLYEVVCYCYSPFSFSRQPISWAVASLSLPQTKLVSNRRGHIASSFERLAVTCHYCAGHVADLALDFGSDALTLCDDALSEEIWELRGNENKLLQTYEDAITAGTQWGQDWIGNGSFDTDHIELDDGESAYIVLSGPHPARKPVKMTADLSLDSGGATGEATVDISPDGVSWQTVLTQDDFESGSAEYALQGSEYMTDIYVRISCNSGTPGKKVNIGSIKFEVERWIEHGAAPVVASGTLATATLSGTGTGTIDGDFYTRRKFL